MKFYDVHRLESQDPAAKHAKKLIQKGQNPDLSNKQVHKTLKFNYPTKCQKKSNKKQAAQ